MTEAVQQQGVGRVAVLVPAAGRGSRLGGPRKQFRRLGGRPLLEQTLRAFALHPEVDGLIVAVPADRVKQVATSLQAAGIPKVWQVVAGGRTRQESVQAALAALPPDVALVLVHDAVRPFILPEQISAVIEATRRVGAAALAIPEADTVRRVRDGLLGETVPRAGLYRMQTPQGFRRDWLEAAHQQPGEAAATDDVELVQRLGYPVACVPGSSFNFKITTAEDWELAQMLWPQWETRLRQKLTENA
ncbi:2-C-methyl-D-erythritol 4-phosphate cytidylyltransferase [Rhodothermus marinus]|uniref:2-C-methyl-D-erythritol 4-phosphate cytidylyltransferase n=1 Tax=Rhodothermus marinus (strain ATCC 43812 / DSM 4252 / R-10) TaxID=518766 RepID=D0MHN1_RHOM4|nr:2-C-methyl-D-erythritol 4-phosphate cytidylyltransferase [Rhodothermus marinus]ACY47989.1 2-C-methyl-D-erythritol 4-phosphate cytidylyltransferase [Rhodothermus marinus DSM 4252]